jgi:uncharacterized protein YpmB
MFDRLFRRAERKIDSVVAKYVRRVLVAVPLLIAALFATVAISAKLVEMYGPIYGHAIMAGAFEALSGVIALFALTGPATPVEQAEAAATADEAAKLKEEDDAPLVSPELLSVLTAAAPVALPGVARAAARNLPILVILAILGYLFARYKSRDATTDEAAEDAADAAADTADTAVAANAEARASEAAATMAARAAAA